MKPTRAHERREVLKMLNDALLTADRIRVYAARTLCIAGVIAASSCASLDQFGASRGHEPPRLKPGLMLNIRVLVDGEVEVNADGKRVRNDGSIVLALLGRVPVEGYTLEELSVYIEKLYDESFFVDPSVEVEFSSEGNDAISPWGCVTVLGRVKDPGKVGIPPTRDLTVSRAVQKAGGFDTSAKSDCIRVSRLKPDGEIEQLEVNLDEVGSKGEAAADIVLQPDDVVFVPESLF